MKKNLQSEDVSCTKQQKKTQNKTCLKRIKVKVLLIDSKPFATADLPKNIHIYVYIYSYYCVFDRPYLHHVTY